MGHALENIPSSYLSHLPYLVRVPVPAKAVTWTLEAMHYWAAANSHSGYAASPFRNFSDPWQPWGAFTWHFKSPEVARKFAEQFDGKMMARRAAASAS